MYPFSEGQIHNREAAVKRTFLLERRSFLHLLTLMVKTRCRTCILHTAVVNTHPKSCPICIGMFGWDSHRWHPWSISGECCKEWQPRGDLRGMPCRPPPPRWCGASPWHGHGWVLSGGGLPPKRRRGEERGEERGTSLRWCQGILYHIAFWTEVCNESYTPVTCM